MGQSHFPACSPHSADLAHNQNQFGQKTTEDLLTVAEKKFSPSPRKQWWAKTSAAEALVVTSLTVLRVGQLLEHVRSLCHSHLHSDKTKF